MRIPATLAIVLCLSLTACSSNEDNLVDQKLLMRKALDAAYAAYGGGDMLAKAKEGATKDTSPEAKYGVQTVAEADRTLFEQYCISSGSGDRLFNFSPKLDAWLKNEKNLDLCKKAAKAAHKVEELERKIEEKERKRTRG